MWVSNSLTVRKQVQSILDNGIKDPWIMSGLCEWIVDFDKTVSTNKRNPRKALIRRGLIPFPEYWRLRTKTLPERMKYANKRNYG